MGCCQLRVFISYRLLIPYYNTSGAACSWWKSCSSCILFFHRFCTFFSQTSQSHLYVLNLLFQIKLAFPNPSLKLFSDMKIDLRIFMFVSYTINIRFPLIVAIDRIQKLQVVLFNSLLFIFSKILFIFSLPPSVYPFFLKTTLLQQCQSSPLSFPLPCF